MGVITGVVTQKVPEPWAADTHLKGRAVRALMDTRHFHRGSWDWDLEREPAMETGSVGAV